MGLSDIEGLITISWSVTNECVNPSLSNMSLHLSLLGFEMERRDSLSLENMTFRKKKKVERKKKQKKYIR